MMFKQQALLVNNEFTKVCDKLLHLILSATATNEHVVKIGQCIRLIKECSSGILATLPFAKLPKIVLSTTFIIEQCS